MGLEISTVVVEINIMYQLAIYPCGASLSLSFYIELLILAGDGPFPCIFILKDIYILIHKINGVKMLLGSYNDDNGL